MEIILGQKADFLRSQYIDTFVDQNLPFYFERIATLRQYADGQCYIGYLWDYLKQASTCTVDEALQIIHACPTPIYVMWDIHSAENIFVDNYWKYPKSAVLSLNANKFHEYLSSFPDDIYVFSPQFNWTIALTHEYVGENRYCRFHSSP